MSRAFLVAGSEAVVVSLWAVASKETMELMVAFYQKLRSGLAPSAALRQVKLEMMGATTLSTEGSNRGIRLEANSASDSSPQTFRAKTHPYFWAPFIVVAQ